MISTATSEVTQQATNVSYQAEFDAIMDGAGAGRIEAMSFSAEFVADLADSLVADSLSGKSAQILFAIVTAVQRAPSLAPALQSRLKALYV